VICPPANRPVAAEEDAAMNKTNDLGAGWYATFNADGELSVHTHDFRTEIRLPLKSVEKLREIFRSSTPVTQ
jgi:hypothetical protein